jgi:hypothetical protein
MQVSDCKWNVQHPKWFPPRKDSRIFLIAAVQADSSERLGPPVLTCHGWSEGHTNKIAVIGPTISSFARGLRKLPSSPFLEMIPSQSDDNGQGAV